MNWQLWSGSSESWDSALLCSKDYAVFQSYAWGEYKKKLNWHVERYFCLDEGSECILSMAQVLIKRLPVGIFLIWVPGGPAFNFLDFKSIKIAELLDKLIEKIRENYPRSIIRVNSQIKNDPILSFEFNRSFLTPYSKLNSGFSVQFKLNKNMSQIIQGMTSKHRYYTKKASSAGLTWIVGNDNQQLYVLSQIHKDMISNKKLSPIKPTLDELFLMRDNLKEGFQILTGFHNELPVTGCLVLLFGKKAFYMAAATSLIGREISAAYAMFARLMQELIDRGFTDFDFGGIAPNSKSAQGVNHYKCGFGGEVVQYLGEWEFACSEKYRIPINLAIRLKADRT